MKLPLGAWDWIPLILHCQPQSSQIQSPEVKDENPLSSEHVVDVALHIVVWQNHDMELLLLTEPANKSRSLGNMNHLHYQVTHPMKSSNVEQQLWTVYTFLFQ